MAAFGALGGLLGPMMGDLTKLFAQQRQSGWDQTRQFAVLRASNDDATTGLTKVPTQDAGSSTDQPVAPLDRIRLEELVAIVEPHVIAITGQDLSSSKGLRVNAVTRVQWATEFLDRHRSVLEPALISKPAGSADPATTSDLNQADPQLAMITNMMNLIGPSMMAMQIGAMAGQLSHRYLSSGDLPMPRADSDTITFIPHNIQRFADAWSLPVDSLRIRVAIDELVLHSVTRIPHLSTMLKQLMTEHVAGFQLDPSSIMDRFEDMGTFDPLNPASQSSQSIEMMDGLSAFSASQSTPAQRAAAAKIQQLTSLIRGYVDHIGGMVSSQLLGGDRRIGEALRRRGFETDDATNMLAALVGVSLNQEQQERSAAFVKGVLDRADTAGSTSGPSSLHKLWTAEANLPTEAEMDAPGLWLARLEYTS